MRDLKKILLIRTDRLGDLILTLPMLPVLRRGFPRARISMLVSSYTAEILNGNRYIEEVLVYDNSSAPIPFLDLRRTLRVRAFDAAIIVHPTFRLALVVFLTGIPIRIGTGYRWYSFLFNRKVYEHRKDSKRHEAEYNLNLLSALGLRPTAPLEFPLEISPASVERVRRLCKSYSIGEYDPFIVIHPGSGGSARDWSPKNFGRLAARCIEEMSLKVILTGVRGEEETVEETLKHIPQGAVNLVSQLGLSDLVALIQRSALVVSNSTGPLHIAAAVGTPVIGLYPPTRECSPQRWGPYTTKKRVFVPDRNVCPRCQGRECEAADCMDQISVEEVFRAAKEFLTSGERPERQEAHAQRAVL